MMCTTHVFLLTICSCSTCHLNTFACPGHVGHIELPVPVYHVTFMDQLLRLLRGTCAYCNRLKLSRIEINRLCCKLRLVQYGLLEDVVEFEKIQSAGKTTKDAEADGDHDSEDDGTDASEGEDKDALIKKRSEFVNKAIRTAGGTHKRPALVGGKIGAIAEERRLLVKEFLAAITKVGTCGSCQG